MTIAMTWGSKSGRELAGCLEARQQVLEGADRVDHVGVAVEDASPLRAAGDLDHGDHVVAVLAHQCEVRFDVGPQRCRAG
jgi:hypothetical protein